MQGLRSIMQRPFPCQGTETLLSRTLQLLLSRGRHRQGNPVAHSVTAIMDSSRGGMSEPSCIGCRHAY